MENGIAIIERNEAETKAVFIDQEALECARLNMRTEKRVADAKNAQKENNRDRKSVV